MTYFAKNDVKKDVMINEKQKRNSKNTSRK